MSIDPGSVEHLSQIISQVVAPAFLLGGVGTFASILTDRLTAVVGRIKDMRQFESQRGLSGEEKSVLSTLRRRAVVLNYAVMLAIASGAGAVIMIIMAFTFALMGLHHVWIAAVLFIISTTLLLFSLAAFAMDIRAALGAHDLH